MPTTTASPANAIGTQCIEAAIECLPQLTLKPSGITRSVSKQRLNAYHNDASCVNREVVSVSKQRLNAYHNAEPVSRPWSWSVSKQRLNAYHNRRSARLPGSTSVSKQRLNAYHNYDQRRLEGCEVYRSSD